VVGVCVVYVRFCECRPGTGRSPSWFMAVSFVRFTHRDGVVFVSFSPVTISSKQGYTSVSSWYYASIHKTSRRISQSIHRQLQLSYYSTYIGSLVLPYQSKHNKMSGRFAARGGGRGGGGRSPGGRSPGGRFGGGGRGGRDGGGGRFGREEGPPSEVLGK
jgi:hypothetical protein